MAEPNKPTQDQGVAARVKEQIRFGGKLRPVGSTVKLPKALFDDLAEKGLVEASKAKPEGE